MTPSPHRISIRQHPRPVPFRGERLRALLRGALSLLPVEASDLRILVVDDAEMERWNRQFLGRPRTTNVLSFPEEEPGGVPAGRASGDILISAPTCMRQTRGWPGSAEDRVFYFIVHGLLHLLGYDHEKGGTEARRMRRTEMGVYRSVLRGKTR